MTDRDKQVIEFLSIVDVATTQNIQDFIFPGVSKTVVSRRLNVLVDYQYIKRSRIKELNNAYVYYINKKPNNLVHELIGTQLYVSIHSLNHSVIRFLRNKKIGNLVTDIILLVETPEGDEDLYFVEVQRSFNPIFKCTDKYKELYYSNDWKRLSDEFPKLLLVTDLKQNPRYKEFTVLKTNTKCDDLHKIFNKQEVAECL